MNLVTQKELHCHRNHGLNAAIREFAILTADQRNETDTADWLKDGRHENDKVNVIPICSRCDSGLSVAIFAASFLE